MKHLYRNKYLNTKPEKLTDYYYDLEEDKNGRLIKTANNKFEFYKIEVR